MILRRGAARDHGVGLDLFGAAERLARVRASSLAIPARHISDLRRYAAANEDDGKILENALAQGPSCYHGGLLRQVSGAEAITFGNSIFFRDCPPTSHTYIHEMVHIHQYRMLGRAAFIASYFGMSLATVVSRFVRGLPINSHRSNPYEEQAYQLEERFRAWRARNPGFTGPPSSRVACY